MTIARAEEAVGLGAWRAAIGASIGLAVGFGPLFVNSFGLFQKPVIGELGWDRGQFSLAFTIATLTTAVLNPYMGSWIDRKGVRPIALIGVILLPTVYFALSRAASFPLFLAAAAVMGLVGATTSYPGYLPLLPPWFPRRLGLAFSVSAAGVGLGTAIAAPTIQHLIAQMGWRGAMQALALGLLVLGLANLLLVVRDRPREERGAAAPEAAAARRAQFGQAIRGALYWRLVIAFAIVPTVSVGINFHMAALLTDRGFSAAQAAGVLAVGALAVLAARLCTGVILDYVAPRTVGAVLFAGQAVGVVLLLWGAGGVVPYVAVCLLGFATGGEGDLMPFVIVRRFGQAAYGQIYGLGFTFYNVGTALGPLLMGVGFGAFQSYAPVLAGFAALSLAATGLVFISAGGRTGARGEALEIAAVADTGQVAP